MTDLNLPPFEPFESAPKILTMDEYLEFCDFNRQHNFDAEAYAWWKEKSIVTEPFRL